MTDKRRTRPFQVLPGRDRRRVVALALAGQFETGEAGLGILISLRERDAARVGTLRLLDSIQTVEASEASDFWRG